MLEIVALAMWCGLIVEIPVLLRSRRMMRRPDNTVALPFKSRILESDRMEKNPPSIGGYASYRLTVWVCFIIFAIVGTFAGAAVVIIPGVTQAQVELYSTIGRWLLGTMGGLLGVILGFSFLKKKAGK